MSTVGKALSLLDSLSQLNHEAGLTDIARLCDLDKATARRLLVELEKHGFVEQDPRFPGKEPAEQSRADGRRRPGR